MKSNVSYCAVWLMLIPYEELRVSGVIRSNKEEVKYNKRDIASPVFPSFNDADNYNCASVWFGYW